MTADLAKIPTSRTRSGSSPNMCRGVLEASQKQKTKTKKQQNKKNKNTKKQKKKTTPGGGRAQGHQSVRTLVRTPEPRSEEFESVFQLWAAPAVQRNLKAVFNSVAQLEMEVSGAGVRKIRVLLCVVVCFCVLCVFVNLLCVCFAFV